MSIAWSLDPGRSWEDEEGPEIESPGSRIGRTSWPRTPLSPDVRRKIMRKLQDGESRLHARAVVRGEKSRLCAA